MTAGWNVLGGCLLIFVLLRCFLHMTQDATEPLIVACGIPFFTPIYWMFRKKTNFYVWLRYHLPIYTLRLPGVRMYVVNSTTLITAVQRQNKLLAFAPIKVKAAIRLASPSKATINILESEAFGEIGSGEYANMFHKAIQTQLSPGSVEFQDMALASRQERMFGLYQWIREDMVMSITNAVYGPGNPFKYSYVREGFWEFESRMMYLLLGLSALAKGSIRARETIVESFRRYYASNGHRSGAGITRTRYEYNAKNQIPLEDIARFELGGMVALITNIVPTTFWVVYHIYSDPALLEACRNEVNGETCETNDPEGRKLRTICLSGLENSCPSLMAVVKEVLRLHTVGTSVRRVMEDHMLSGKYLLKKGSIVTIPGQVQHSDKAIWGQDAGQFNHERFLTPARHIPPSAFRAFGGGVSLCPGRHFATSMILAFTAMLIMRFDFVPVRGTWPRPTTERAGAWEVTPQPDEDIEVQIGFRNIGEKHQRWAFSLF
ncbi:cytochrome P450 [Westerdykella ornata]|uniref:Cytochrome P450 n=1 Tax=Westerdykella ornata TaxID=318751 RepID=A0A6A6JSH8_WESOR|nr:cytochrome P450 [Westerdykella ornata]KAF2279512.1 cytochrome P450 [Westerdykella ornata]